MRLLPTILLFILSVGWFEQSSAKTPQVIDNQYIYADLAKPYAFVSRVKSKAFRWNTYQNAVFTQFNNDLALDPPVAGDDGASTDEDTDLVDFDILANDGGTIIPLDKGSVDLDVSTPGFQDTFTTTEGTFSVNNQGKLTFSPVLNYNGLASVTYTVQNILGEVSNVATITVTVNPVNDPPAITAQVTNPWMVTEDTPFTPQLSDFTITDPDGDVSFTLTVLAGANYTASSNTVTPAANYNGSLTVNVIVNDGVADSPVFGAAITVTPVNDPPVITAQNSNPINATEDTPFTLQLSDFTITDPDVGDSYTFTVLPGTNYTASGNTVTPAANYNGSLTVNVNVNDGTVDSPTFGALVSVAAVNDPPTITSQNSTPINATEDTPFVLKLSDYTISDPDLSDSFTLTVLAGANYTASGNTVTPAANYSGPLTVNVKVNDGAADSPTFGTSVSVAPVNDPPVISGQTTNPILATEDTPFTLHLSDFTITDPDAGASFSLTVLAGTNYTTSGNTVTPAANYNGSLTVNVKVNDGTADSPTFGASVSVASVNDAPVITGQASLSTGDGQPITIKFSDLTVTDPDNTYPSGFDLSILSGANYSVSGFTVTPSVGYSGNLPVKVFVSDGTASSAIFTLSIQVNYTNKPPVITGQQTLSINEDTPITLKVTDVAITDPDNVYPGDFTLIVQSGTNYTFSGNTVTPALNFNGTLSVKVIANDGSLNSAPYTVQVTVNAVNDAPVINSQTPTPFTATEDTPFTLLVSNLVISDPDNSSFTLTVLPGTNYTAVGNLVTPAQDFNGNLTLNVKVNDGSADSPSFGVAVKVTPVNDAPQITAQIPNPINATQNIAFTLQLSNFTIVDPDNTVFTLSVLAGTNYTFSGNTVTPALNFNGTLTINVKVRDGAADSPIFGVAVNVGAVNVVPVITGQKTLSMNEDETLTLQLTDLTVTDPDDNYPQDFTLVLPASGTNYTTVGNVITPSPNYFGTLSVSAKVNDGLANSAAFNVQITVNPVNDSPAFDPIADVQMAENDAAITIKVNNITSGPLENQSLIFSVTSSNPGLIASIAPVNIGTPTSRTFTIKPEPDQNGIADLVVAIIDVDANSITFSRTFRVTVQSINAPPTLTNMADVVMQEDDAEKTVSLAGISAGPSETQVLAVTASANNTNLIDKLTVGYTTPQSTGTLKIKLKPDAYGTAVITVTVTDDGAGAPAPNQNTISKTFNLTVQSVNDLPVFKSIPLTLATVGELFTDSVKVDDIDNTTISLTASIKPAWLTLATSANGKRGKLSGTPPPGSFGNIPVELRAKDSGSPVFQSYQLTIITRPVISPVLITTNEDVAVDFTAQNFTSAFADPSGSALTEIQITALPKHGTLQRNAVPVVVGDKIPVAYIATVTYLSELDYYGKDTLRWNGSNGSVYSTNDTYLNFVINPVNDAPRIITLETDSLKFPIGSEKLFLTPLFQVVDVDSDSLVRAEISFRKENYSSLYDVLTFTKTAHITGSFDSNTGLLVFTGQALVSEYNDIIHSIQYIYNNVQDPKLQTKSVTFSLSDGLAFSELKERYIKLIFTFEDLDIVNGFTPNGDGDNDTWEVVKQEREADLGLSKLTVYDKRGVVVFESQGFEKKWDGTYKGKLLPSDSYFYTIEAVDSKLSAYKKLYRGVVTILHDNL